MNKFTKDQINNWIELSKLSDNKDFVGDPDLASRGFLKRDLVEAKVQVDRWNVVTTDWVFHTSKKDLITTLFAEDPKDLSGVRKALEVLIKYAADLKLGDEFKGKSASDFSDEDMKKLVGKTNSNEPFHIWGSNVHFTDNIPDNVAIGLALNSDGMTLMTNDSSNITNSIVIFNMP
jgi:hypothetical protein